MRSLNRFFGVLVFGFGILLSLWISTSVLGRAHSQSAPSSSPAASRPAPPPAPKSSPPEGQVAEPKIEAPGPETEAIFQNPEGYSYDPTGRRDPFRPYGQSQTTTAPDIRAPDVPAKPAEPLQQFDVSQLKVVGIMWEVRNPKAMVKDPAGKLYMIQRQTRIGRNNGFVAAIREGEIVVVEPAIGDNGLQTAATRVLTLTR